MIANRKKKLVLHAATLAVAVAGLLGTAPIARAGNEVFYRPRLEGYRVDWCESWARNCGKPAADRFCRNERGRGSRAISYRKENDIGRYTPTRTQRSPRVCSSSACDGFYNIVCSEPTRTTSEPYDCSLNKSKSFGVGSSKYVRGELRGQLSVYRPKEKKTSDINGSLRGCFAGHCGTLASAGVSARSHGSSKAELKIGGWNVYSKRLSFSGTKDFGPYILKKSLGGKIAIVPGVTIGATAKFGTGVEIHTGYNIRTAPPLADVDGTVKTFANGSGTIKASVLGGVVGSAAVKGTLNLPSPDMVGDLGTLTCRVKADAKIKLNPWKLKAEAIGKVGCVPFLGCLWKDSKTLASTEGRSRTYRLF